MINEFFEEWEENDDSCEVCGELNGGGANGGFARKEVSTIIAGTNDGKTILTSSIACDAVRDGHNVFAIGLEGKKLQTPLRLISNLSNVSFKRLTMYRDYVAKNDEPSLNKYFNVDELERIKKAESEFKDKVRFNHAIQNCEVEKIIAIVRSAHKNKKIDLLIIDYGQLLESLKMFKREDQLISHSFRLLEKLSAEINCATVIPMQVNREGSEK